MNCEEFERELEELDDDSNPSPEQDAHRSACAPCSELTEDLNFIRQQARQLLLLEQPSDRVWQQIRSKLEQSGVIREPAHRRLFGPAAFGWFGRLSMGLAYTAVFLLALGVVYVYSILSPRVLPPSYPARRGRSIQSWLCQ